MPVPALRHALAAVGHGGDRPARGNAGAAVAVRAPRVAGHPVRP